jgi:iron complex transport system ATP-binding protein
MNAEAPKNISVSGLTLEIGGRRILDGVSLDVEPGSLVYVIGRNGAGKSTLFKCVAGVIKDFAGDISIGGRSSARLAPRDRARLVAYVPQSSPDDVPYTVSEFLEMSRYPWRTVSSDAADRRAIAGALEMTGTGDLAGRVISSLSGGERQKVMIASAIAQETGVILMDEPTTYLDYACQVETINVMSLVNRQRGATLMIVTHDVNLPIHMAGTGKALVCAMAGGRVIWTGTPAELMESGRLSDIYGVRFGRYFSGEAGEAPLLAPEMGGAGA